nr:HlyD family secretion protein [Acetatifactor sp.]
MLYPRKRSDGCMENQYALEITNRRDLLLANVNAASPDDSSQTKTYRVNVKVMRETLQGYEEKKTKLEAVIDAIKKQNNPFGEEDAYYASIEQQIETIGGNIQSVQASIATTENQIKALDNSKEEDVRGRYFLSEKGTVQTEILTYQAKQKELENAIRQRSLLNEKRVVTADTTGYFYLGGEMRIGSYLQAGSKIGSIYPEEETEYHAEVYVSNADVGKIHEGQEVKFEIAAYPSSEFGYFTGRVKSIAKDISVDQG